MQRATPQFGRRRRLPTRRALGFQLPAVALLVVATLCLATKASSALSYGLFAFGHEDAGGWCTACNGECLADQEVSPRVALLGVHPREILDVGVWWNTAVHLRNGTVFSCGWSITLRNDSFRLELAPQELPVGNDGGALARLAVGSLHATLLTSNGDVWSLGTYANNGLGMSVALTDEALGKKMLGAENMTSAGETIVDVRAGSYGDLAISSFGNVWVWGSCRVGECGLGDTSSNMTTATRLDTFLQDGLLAPLPRIHSASLGNGCNVLSTNASLLTSGRHNCIGRPPLSGSNHTVYFSVVPGSQQIAYPVRTISPADNSFIILDATRHLWAFGTGPVVAIDPTTAETGLLSLSNLFSFDASIEHLSSGYDIAYVLTSSGTLYYWGRDATTRITTDTPKPITFPSTLFDPSVSILSKIYQPTGGNVIYASFEPICDSCVVLPPGSTIPPAALSVSHSVTFIGNLSLLPSTTISIDVSSTQPSALVNVTGCASLSGKVDLNLLDTASLSTSKAVPIPLFEASCFTSSNPAINVKSKLPKKCQKVTASTRTTRSPDSGRSTLTVLLKLNDDSCKQIWWIILVCVLGGVIIIGAIAAIIFVTTRKRVLRRSRATLRQSKQVS